MKEVIKNKPKRFVIRTIRNGKVKIFNNYYYPINLYKKYDGRLNEMRYAFGLYWKPREDGKWQLEDYVQLWGTEEMYNCADGSNKELFSKLYREDPQKVDGNLPWLTWRVKNEKT